MPCHNPRHRKPCPCSDSVANTPSKGSLCFTRYGEFFHGPDGTLYLAPSDCPLDVNGYRQGARFECQPRADGHRKYLLDAFGVEL